MRQPKTTTLWNRLDPRQPSERDVYSAAYILVNEMGYSSALVHARDKAIEFHDDRQASVVWTRIFRAVKALWKPPAA